MILTGTVAPDRPLIVVALAEEAAHLDTPYPVLLTGVGKVSAALAVARVLGAGVLPREIVNLGTAGALRSGLGGLHEISRVVQHDFHTATIQAVTGYTFGGPLDLPGAGPVLATGDVFVSDPVLRTALAEHADLVDMEGYAVAAAAAAYGVPLRMVKQVSDEADGEAVTGWAEAVDHCARLLAGWLAEWQSDAVR
ncbi:nucleosidase [Catellatospora methionotrophica]|uniref:Nucleosidase n=1 Tax=Catellatospora methionotrophica TaxID=121620 RepID=A0A8J3LJ06_9ACTN|nr:nucleosidase [Catellatospora methionotrophica]GIG13530.1 nucleosidase [Catellatospora methionotrophica]